jgi:hypothetical protein
MGCNGSKNANAPAPTEGSTTLLGKQAVGGKAIVPKESATASEASRNGDVPAVGAATVQTGAGIVDDARALAADADVGRTEADPRDDLAGEPSATETEVPKADEPRKGESEASMVEKADAAKVHTTASPAPEAVAASGSNSPAVQAPGVQADLPQAVPLAAGDEVPIVVMLHRADANEESKSKTSAGLFTWMGCSSFCCAAETDTEAVEAQGRA